ncbi:UDP-glucuronosyltransferase 1A8-like [Physella acuta]|uniref:UDP-glucuronosyltransferase 1A8-like n=1 Tax=Physella acuta TaxID=109671 RepID=UPI0027DE56EF|nr:UDP-glucuronosyltransferase 1A8-like [Physella acuta]
MRIRECGSGNVDQGMWVSECGSANVGQGMWVRECGSMNEDQGMRIRECGSGNGGNEDQGMWVSKCGSGNVGQRMWVNECGSANVGQGMWVTMLGLKFLVLTLSVDVLTPVGSSRVVMFPGFLKSFFIQHANIGQALIDLGHEVWSCMPEYLSSSNLVKFKDIKILKYGEALGDIEQQYMRNTNFADEFWDGKDTDLYQLVGLAEVYKYFTSAVLEDKTFIDNITNLKADFLVIDGLMLMRNIFVLPYKLDVPFAVVGFLHDMVMHRVPFSPAVEPMYPYKFNNRMNFYERLTSTLRTLLELSYDVFSDSDIVTRIAPEKPYTTVGDIILKAEIFIAELDHILDYPRPMLPNTKLIGGSSVSEPKPLIGEFKQFVDETTNGIVVVSFGSKDMTFPVDILKTLSSAFKQLEYDVIWKVNITSPAPNKILTSHWIPQNDLLGHPKTKVFVSHCGKNGQYEALYHAVPILCLPIYGDQFYNSERIRVKSFGLIGDVRKITTEELTSSIKELAHDNKYKRNIEKASKLFKELYKVPSKEAAYWIDHVMKYGGDYMRSSGQEMPLYQFLLLDVIAFIAAVLSGVVVIFVLIVRFCCRLLYKHGKYKPKTE